MKWDLIVVFVHSPNKEVLIIEG